MAPKKSKSREQKTLKQIASTETNHIESPWSLHPELHKGVDALLTEDLLSFEFNEADNENECTDTYDTNIMGVFKCPNKACTTKKWSSKIIAVTIRQYTRNRYNARVYHQRCKKCGYLGCPELNNSYAERVAYRLRKWSGVEMGPPPYSGRQESNRPHQRSLCEGCINGHCRKGKFVEL